MVTGSILPDPTAPDAAISAGLLIARLVFGLTMSAHGAQKLFGWFGGPGLAATSGFLGQLGFRPARLLAAIASSVEVAGGLLVAIGLLGPIGPSLLLSVMIVAAVTVHWNNGFFVATNGIELPLLYAAFAVALALSGPGRYSLDAVLGLGALWSLPVAVIVLVLGAIGAVANLALRRTALRPTSAPSRTA